MVRRYPFVALAALALAACQPPSPPAQEKRGAVVAQGAGISVTAEELKARLDEQSPFIRQRYNTLERKKEFLDNLLRFEVLAKAAEKQGLASDPEVQQTMKKVLVQKLVQKNFSDADAAKNIPEAEVQKFYDDHRDDYQKPFKIRLGVVVEKDAKAAKKLLAQVRADEKKSPLAFSAAAKASSKDAASAALGGDIGYKSKAELEQAYGKAFAETAVALKDGEISDLLETPQGLVFAKATGRQEEINRTFEQMKGQIATRLQREKKTREFEEYVKRLRDEAKITVNDAELDKVQVAAAPAAPPQGAMPAPPHGAMPAPAPPAAPR